MDSNGERPQAADLERRQGDPEPPGEDADPAAPAFESSQAQPLRPTPEPRWASSGDMTWTLPPAEAGPPTTQAVKARPTWQGPDDEPGANGHVVATPRPAPPPRVERPVIPRAERPPPLAPKLGPAILPIVAPANPAAGAGRESPNGDDESADSDEDFMPPPHAAALAPPFVTPAVRPAPQPASEPPANTSAGPSAGASTEEEHPHDVAEATGAGTRRRDPVASSILSDVVPARAMLPDLARQPAAAEPSSRWSPGSFFYGEGQKAATRRSLARTGVALVVVAVLAAGTLAFVSVRSRGTELAFILRSGRTLSYDMTLGMDGKLTAGSRHQALAMTSSGHLTWRVVSASGSGVATVQAVLTNPAGKANGRRLRFSTQPATLPLQVGRDGRILSGGEFALASIGAVSAGPSGAAGAWGASPVVGIPGPDQFMPLLPARPVRPGDTWGLSVSRPAPFGQGTLRYVSRGELLRYEDVGGTRTALIHSTSVVPIDERVDVRQLLSSTGLPSSSLGLPARFDPVVHYTGRMVVDETSWFDPSEGEMVGVSARVGVSLVMVLQGFPASELSIGNRVAFAGTITLVIDRPTGAPLPR